MKELQRRIIEKAGLNPADFEPRQTAQNNAEPTAPVGTEERITALEQALEASLTALRELGVTGND